MIHTYQSQDPYLAFAKLAEAVPPNATKQSHKAERDQYKACVLAVQYGMGAASLSNRIKSSEWVARGLLEKHRNTFSQFWNWSDAALDHAMLHNRLHTVLGWQVQVGGYNANPRSLRNFPMQANGAELLRLTCCWAVAEGLRICAPVHDALLIENPIEELETQTKRLQEIMAEASREVLGGFSLRTDAYLIREGERFVDDFVDYCGLKLTKRFVIPIRFEFSG